MKIKFDKDLYLALGIAAAGGLIITAILALLAWISWASIFVISTVILLPIVQAAIKFWKEKDCFDIADFINELQEAADDPDNDNKIC